jgi:hypothetical protein
MAMEMELSAQVLQRIRAEYLEMPGLSLRPEQVQRLCGVDRGSCDVALETLVKTGFLSRRPDGAYGRYPDPEIARPTLVRRQRCRACAPASPRRPGSSDGLTFALPALWKSLRMSAIGSGLCRAPPGC